MLYGGQKTEKKLLRFSPTTDKKNIISLSKYLLFSLKNKRERVLFHRKLDLCHFSGGTYAERSHCKTVVIFFSIYLASRPYATMK